MDGEQQQQQQHDMWGYSTQRVGIARSQILLKLWGLTLNFPDL